MHALKNDLHMYMMHIYKTKWVTSNSLSPIKILHTPPFEILHTPPNDQDLNDRDKKYSQYFPKFQIEGSLNSNMKD